MVIKLGIPFFPLTLTSDTIITTLCPCIIASQYNTSPLVYKGSFALVNDVLPHFDICVSGEYGVKESWKMLAMITIGPVQRIGQVLGLWKDSGKVFVEKLLHDKFENEPRNIKQKRSFAKHCYPTNKKSSNLWQM